PEARLPFADRLAGAFGLDAQPQAFAGTEALDHLTHHVGRLTADDGHAAESAQQPAQWPTEQFALGHEGDVGAQGNLEQQAPDAIPPRRMGCDDQYQFRHVWELAFQPPPARLDPGTERVSPGAVRKLRHRRRQARRQRGFARSGVQSSLPGRPRLRFIAPRCFLPARRRSFEARVGFVATRFLGGVSEPRMISIRRSRTSSRLRAWSRKRRAWITSTPSPVSRRSRRANTRARTASGSDGDCATSKRNSTALSVRLTCCPPGPSARRKRSVSSDSGMSMEGEMRMTQRLRDLPLVSPLRNEGRSAANARAARRGGWLSVRGGIPPRASRATLFV